VLEDGSSLRRARDASSSTSSLAQARIAPTYVAPPNVRGAVVVVGDDLSICATSALPLLNQWDRTTPMRVAKLLYSHRVDMSRDESG
jgi:hypothetical protein